jgi:hypothetical protein
MERCKVGKMETRCQSCMFAACVLEPDTGFGYPTP